MVICILTEKREGFDALHDLEFIQNLKQQVRTHYGYRDIDFVELSVDKSEDADVFANTIEKRADKEACVLLSGEWLKDYRFLSVVATAASLSRHCVSYVASSLGLATMAQIVIDAVYKNTGVTGVDRTTILAVQDRDGDTTVEHLGTDRIIYNEPDGSKG